MTPVVQPGLAQPSPAQASTVRLGPLARIPTLRCFCKTELVQVMHHAPRGGSMESRNTESAGCMSTEFERLNGPAAKCKNQRRNNCLFMAT